MQTSEATDKIIPAFIAAEHEVGVVKKTADNPHFKSKYADLEAVMEACAEALKKNKLAVWQSVSEDGSKMVTRLYHESGQWLEGYTPLIIDKNTMQGLGSAYTYARRYGLMAALGIAPEDDDGNAASSTEKAFKPGVKTAAPKTTEEAAHVADARDILLKAEKITDAEEFSAFTKGCGERLATIKAASVKTYEFTMKKLGEIDAALRIAA
jgi:hypothetical protein